MKNYKIRAFILRLVFLCSAVIGVSSAPAQTKIKSGDQPINLKLLRPSGKLLTIKAQVGAKTYDFLFDSGGGATIITPDVAQDIGCKSLGRSVGFRASGEKLEGARCENVDFKIGDFSTTTDARILNLMAYFDKDTPIFGGIVSLQTFENQAITLDLANNSLVVETEKSLANRIAGMKQIKSRLSRQAGGATINVFVAASTPNGRIWLELDTGNSGPVFLARNAIEQLQINLDAPNKARQTKPVKLDLDGFGTIETAAREREIIYDGQLNFDTIIKWLVTIDLRTGNVWLKSNEPDSGK